MQHPITAIVAAGGTGEMYSLTPSEHQEVVKATVDEVRGRIPVIAGTGFNQQMAVAFALYPTQMSDLMAVADAGAIMPPKSTWFEPKLADGAVSHVLD